MDQGIARVEIGFEPELDDVGVDLGSFAESEEEGEGFEEGGECVGGGGDGVFEGGGVEENSALGMRGLGEGLEDGVA